MGGVWEGFKDERMIGMRGEGRESREGKRRKGRAAAAAAAAHHSACPTICGWREMRITPVSHMCSFGSSVRVFRGGRWIRVWVGLEWFLVRIEGRWVLGFGLEGRSGPGATLDERARERGACDESRRQAEAPRRTHGRNLEDVEGRGVEEPEGEEVDGPHRLVHARDAPHIPQRRAVVAVVDEVRLLTPGGLSREGFW